MEVINVEEPIIAVRVSQYPDDKKSEFLILPIPARGLTISNNFFIAL